MPRRRTYTGAVRSLQCIKDRCRVDDITGCWLWGLYVSTGTPRAKVAARVRDKFGMGVAAQSVPRVAWLLSGRTLGDGHVVWRAGCNDKRCVNPEHMRCGTRKAHCQDLSRLGAFVRSPAQKERLRRLGVERFGLSAERVEELRKAIESGATLMELQEREGVSRVTLSRIKNRKHWHDRVKTDLAPAASVFAWGGSYA